MSRCLNPSLWLATVALVDRFQQTDGMFLELQDPLNCVVQLLVPRQQPSMQL